MTKPKSKSKMIKALRKWEYMGICDCPACHSELKMRNKSFITKLFNEAIAKREK